MTLYRVHLWTALALGLHFCLVGLTGSLLVFREEITAWQYASISRVRPEGPRIPVSQVVAIMKRAYPTATAQEIATIGLPKTAEGVYQFRLGSKEDIRHQRRVTIDPYRGIILGDVAMKDTLLGWAALYHIYFVVGPKGTVFNSAMGGVIALLLLSGLWLWWPATIAQLKTRLLVKRGVSYKRRLYDLHNVFGIYTLPVLIVSCVTGFSFSFTAPIRAVLARVTNAPPDLKPLKVTPVGKRLPIDDLLRVAEATVPEARIVSVKWPVKPQQPIAVQKERGRGGLLRVVKILLDPYSGKVLRVEDERDDALAQKVIDFAEPLHFGAWGGLASKTLYALIGLAPTALYVTGLLKWREKRRSGRREKQAAPTPAAEIHKEKPDARAE